MAIKFIELSKDIQTAITNPDCKGFGVSKKGNVTFNGRLINSNRIEKILKWNDEFGGLKPISTIYIGFGLQNNDSGSSQS